MRVVWTEPALRDLAAARSYIQAHNPDAAARQGVELIISAVTGLVR